jgi:hypothetical protein
MMAEKNETALREALKQAESQNDPDAVQRAEKHLHAAGYERAAKKRQAAGRGDEQAHSRAPEGRSAPQKQTAVHAKNDD